MQLTIKQKIILGFSAIGLLLIAASSFFYHSLGQIYRANNNVEIIAVPVQKQSNALQIQLLKMVKQGALAYTQNNTLNLKSSLAEFKKLQLNYDVASSELKNKVADQPLMQSTLNKANTVYQQYLTHSLAMFEAKLAEQTSLINFQQYFNEFDQIRTQASDVMLDLELIEAPGQAQLLDEVIGSGTRIDDLLFTLKGTMSDLNRIADSEKLIKHQEDMTFLIGNIKNNFDYLKQQAAPLNAEDAMANFNLKLTVLEQHIINPGYLYSSQKKVLEQNLLAEQSYLDTEVYFNTNYSELDKLAALADKRFNNLQQTAKEKISTGESLSIVLALVFIVMASFISVVTTRAMLGPLAAVNKALARIASGDLSRRMVKRNNDEFGTLVDNINKLSDELTQLLNTINTQAHSLDESAINTNRQSQRISQSVSQQIEQVENAKHLAAQMYTSSNKVKEEADNTATHVSEASSHSHEINKISSDNKDRIGDLSTRLSESVEVMTRLSQHSENIGGILTTIGSIADQTNLLALNAAIEAARAGDHGRGFSVVADEVRSLAARTQSSTAEIQAMISALQLDTNIAVKAISQGQNQATECVNQSEELSRAIGQIETTLNAINNMSESITFAAQEQLVYSQDIDVRLNETALATNKNAEEAQTMHERSDKVNKLAQSLMSSVERFKL